jgi:hypothetical protein
MALLLFRQTTRTTTMENEPQATETTSRSRDTSAAREPANPRRPVFAAEGAARENRVSEPALATDGQTVEAGYGHGV